MKSVVFIILLFLLPGCNKYVNSYANWASDEKAAKMGMVKTAQPIQEITIDNTYNLYVRQVCKPIEEKSRACNCELLPPASRKRIEIEYLFFSTSNENFIHITTVPDVYFESYSYDLFNRDSLVNIKKLNRFHFGKVDHKKSEIRFLQKDATQYDLWRFDRQAKALEITSVVEQKAERNHDVMELQFAFDQPVVYYQRESFQIGFKENVRTNTTDSLVLVDENSFYFTNEDKYKLYFVLETVPPGQDSKTLFFRNVRIMYSPKPLVR